MSHVMFRLHGYFCIHCNKMAASKAGELPSFYKALSSRSRKCAGTI